MSEQQLVDCDTVDQACDSGLMSNGFDVAEQNDQCYNAMKSACKASSVTWRSHRKCHGK